MFVLIMCASLFLLAGLVIDGGNVLAAKRRAFAVSDEAARSGAQAIQDSAYRTNGALTFDTSAARAAGSQYISSSGLTGSVDVENGVVIADVDVPQTMAILGIAGIGTVTVHGTAKARVIQGVTGPGV